MHNKHLVKFILFPQKFKNAVLKLDNFLAKLKENLKMTIFCIYGIIQNIIKENNKNFCFSCIHLN